MRIASLAVVLAGLWLLLSGHTEPLLLGFGAGSCVLVVFLAHRMGVLDLEGHPIELLPRAVLYTVWLLGQIVHSNVEVARLVLGRGSALRPTVFRIRASQRTDVGRATYANSITLTPGTVCIFVREQEFLVHSLTAKAAEQIRAGETDRRVAALERKAR